MSQIQPTCSNLCMTIFLDSFLFFLFAQLTGQHMVTWLSFASMYLCKKIHMIYINAYQIPQRKTAFLIYTFRTNDISKNICSTTFHRQEPCLQEMGRIVACSAKIRRHWHFQDMNWIGMQFTSETIVLQIWQIQITERYLFQKMINS